jgi:hypothetical protein
MRIVTCLLALLLVSVLAIPVPAHAGGSTDAALALGSFAVLNQLLRGETVLHDIFGHGRPHSSRQTVIVQPPPQVVYAPPPQVIYYAPQPATVVYTPSRGGHHHHHFVPPGHYKRYGGHGHRGHHKHYRHH